MAEGGRSTITRRSLSHWQRSLTAALLVFAASLEAALAEPTLYVGRIITMDATRPVAEAVLVEGDRIVAVGPGGGSSHYYGLFLDGTSTGPRRVGFLQDGNGSYPPAYSAAGVVTTGTAATNWTHLAVTHDGTTTRIYVNGALSTTTPDRRALGTFSSAMLMVAGSKLKLAVEPPEWSAPNKTPSMKNCTLSTPVSSETSASIW